MMGVVPLWPRRRSTAAVLSALVALQATLFFTATERSFFTHEDCYHFALAHDRSFLRYLVTPIIHTYPAPGHRLLFYVLDTFAPMSYAAARLFLLAVLGMTTILLAQLMRTLAGSDRWWTVALTTPFALSLTLVGPIGLWSNGVPVIPPLLCTVFVFSAWIRSYSEPRSRVWLALTVVAIAAAGAFYTKFLLLPMYLLFIRLALLPKLFGLAGGVRTLWQERLRWAAVAAPPAAFLAVYILSGLAARSYIPGERPFIAHLMTAWFGAVVPVSVLNVPLDQSTDASVWWAVVIGSQLLFWALVGATWARSSLALRGWALFLMAFVVNTVMVGSARLPGFGLAIAYWLRYYPEVVLFVPIALALALRQGAERRPGLAWERTTAGQVAIGLLACIHALSLAIWAPRLVSRSDGAQARVWFDNLRGDLARLEGEPVLRVIDAETPDYVVLWWMAPYNRVSTILQLLRVNAAYNDVSGTAYLVLDDGRLAEADFRPATRILPPAAPSQRLDIAPASRLGERWCLREREGLAWHPEGGVEGERLGLRVVYSSMSRARVKVEVDTGNVEDPDRRYRTFELQPFRGHSELVDLATSRLRAIQIEPNPGDSVCFEQMEIGLIVASAPPGRPTAPR